MATPAQVRSIAAAKARTTRSCTTALRSAEAKPADRASSSATPASPASAGRRRAAYRLTWVQIDSSSASSRRSSSTSARCARRWTGFGPLQGRLWIAPGEVNARDIVTGLGLEAHARVFRARADELTDLAAMIADAYDLAGVAARYQGFLDRWEAAAPAADPLAARLRLIAEWLGAIRRDPRLPVEHLPAGWPAVRAQKLFRELELAYAEPARIAAAERLDLRPAGAADAEQGAADRSGRAGGGRGPGPDHRRAPRVRAGPDHRPGDLGPGPRRASRSMDRLAVR